MDRGYLFQEGRLPRGGWYVHPFCHRSCCRSDGPFATRAEAARWATALARAMLGDRPRAKERLWRESDALYLRAGGKRWFASNLNAYRTRMGRLRFERRRAEREALSWREDAEGDSQGA
jgi:hypothetical protein